MAAGSTEANARTATASEGWCQEAKITGYSRLEYSGYTYDGTDILSGEPIAAASWNIPIDSMVWIDGYGTVRIADRGALGSRGWIDVAVWSRSEAFALTSTRTVCVYPPGTAP